MTLSERERSDPLMMRLRDEYKARLEKLRADNDNDAPELATAKRRGQILEIKRFLEMWAVKPKIEVE